MILNLLGRRWSAVELLIRAGPTAARTIATTASLNLKEIHETKKGNQIVVEGVRVKSPREGKVIESHKDAPEYCCSLCRLGLKRLKYSDVLILSQFIEPDGRMMDITTTGLCSNKYKLVKTLVKQAQLSKLLPRPPDFESFGPWDELNTYHEWPQRYRDQPMRQVQPEYWKRTFRRPY